VIDLDEQVLGPEHFFTLETRTGLGEALYHEGKYAGAEREYLSVLKVQEKVMGPEHPDTKKYEKLQQELVAKTD
jgi:eukaryotic-like serine/threonine-protein kinase